MLDIEQLESRMGVSIEVLEEFCKRWKVGELALFGSVLREDFGPNSDIDLLVTFNSRPTPGLFGVVRMENELTSLMGRKVDLVSRPAIENSKNYIRRKAILDSVQVVYEA